MTPTERAYEHLRRLVAERPHGRRLPSERDLALDLGVSRQSVKVALGRLIDQGLVVRRVGSGSFVHRPEAGGEAPDVGILDIIEMRRIVEPGLILHAISRATEDDFVRIEAAWTRMAAATTSAEIKQGGYAVTLEIARATRNPLCVQTYELLLRARERLGWDVLTGLSDTPERRRLRIAQARDLVDAIRQHDRQRAVRLATDVVEQLVRDALTVDEDVTAPAGHAVAGRTAM